MKMMTKIRRERGNNKIEMGTPIINPDNTEIQNQQRIRGDWY